MKTSAELEQELEKARVREQWESEHPEALAEARETGRKKGFNEGWQAACRWFGQMGVVSAGIHRTSPPEPIEVSVEAIADFVKALRGEGLR